MKKRCNLELPYLAIHRNRRIDPRTEHLSIHEEMTEMFETKRACIRGRTSMERVEEIESEGARWKQKHERQRDLLPYSNLLKVSVTQLFFSRHSP